jgi:hypothetical protein
MTPVARIIACRCRRPGWREVLNTDAELYGGSGNGQPGEGGGAAPWHGQAPLRQCHAAAAGDDLYL